MLRALAATCLAAALIGSAAALAADGREYEGTVKGTPKGTVAFKVVKQPAGDAVKGFKGKSIPLDCAGADVAQDFKIGDAMPLDADGRFAGTFTPSNMVAITGRLKSSGKAGGSLRISPAVPTGSCDSGILRWKAKRER